MTTYNIAIGIDTGTTTGVAVWHIQKKSFIYLAEEKIHNTLSTVLEYIEDYGADAVIIFVEDARKRKFFRGENIAAKQQGAGSIKRDAVIWEDFLTEVGVAFVMKAPKNTKIDAEIFFKMTGVETKKTQTHKRDAAMMVMNFTNSNNTFSNLKKAI